MARVIHCIMILYIVFILIQIGSVLANRDPSPAPLTIWEDVRPL